MITIVAFWDSCGDHHCLFCVFFYMFFTNIEEGAAGSEGDTDTDSTMIVVFS